MDGRVSIIGKGTITITAIGQKEKHKNFVNNKSNRDCSEKK
jgi:hypothetical protein